MELNDLCNINVGLEDITIEYRIHYDESGTITGCSMTNHPSDVAFIVVSKQEYETYYKFKVIDGKLTPIMLERTYPLALRKSSNGFRTVKNHAGLILDSDEEYEETVYYG